MKHILLFSLFFVYSQSNSTNLKSDSTTTLLETQNSLLKKENKELNKRLLIYQSKEDYYAAALGDQATRFSLIVGSIVGLFALLSYAGFKNEVESVKKSYNKQMGTIKSQVADFEKKILEHEFSINTTSVYALSMGAQSHEEQNKPYLAFELYLAAAAAQSSALIIAQKINLGDKEITRTTKSVSGNLNCALTELKKCTSNDKNKVSCSGRNEIHLEKLKTISESKIVEFENVAAEIRVVLNNYIK